MAIGEALASEASRRLRADWRGQRAALWGAALLALTIAAVVLYYHATPSVILDPDSPAYLRVARTIMAGGGLVDPSRLPGYPLLISLVWLVAGGRTLDALGVTQAALFVVGIMEVYGVGLVVWRRAWLAFIPAALAGVNVHLISYMHPLLTEALTLALLGALALALLWWMAAPSAGRLWLVALVVAATFMTRPEWVFLPIPLMAALALLAWRRGDRTVLRATLTHGALAVVALYALVGAYIFANGQIHGYYGFSEIQAYNLLGKTLQYHLVGDAPAHYAATDAAMRSFLARGQTDPWQAAREYAPFRADHLQLMSDYARAMILRHPVAFAAGCWGTLLHSLTFSEPFHPMPAAGGAALAALNALSDAPLRLMWPVLLIAPLWWLLWARGRGDTTQRRRAEALSLVALLVAYDLAMTTAGGYIYYSRLHAPFDPLLMLLVVGSALAGLAWGVGWLRARLRPASGVEGASYG
ncbi:MAG: hypothetical protein KGO05_06405 [Chloroflexota bacterium]|nr:hypothetical protein [Chloroflexota bacterium]